MKRLLISCALLLAAGCLLRGQDMDLHLEENGLPPVTETLPAPKDSTSGVKVAPAASKASTATRSIEISTGPAPFHALLFGSLADTGENEADLAEKGRRLDTENASYPSFNLGFFLPVSSGEIPIDFGLMTNFSWRRGPLLQYPVFGTDPEGRNRYDMTASTRIGTSSDNLSFALMGLFRFRWYNGDALRGYSATGLGWSTATSWIPLPYLTPVGVQLGRGALFANAELTLSPAATFCLIGLGWRF